MKLQPYTNMFYRMIGEPTQEQLQRQREYLEHRNMRWREEYKLIKAKRSTLSSAKRKMIVDFIEADK